jgi:hypothetical protein
VHIHESIFNETFGLGADHPSFLFQTTPGAPDIKFFSVNQFVGFQDTIRKIGVTFGALFEAALGMCREMNIGDCISNKISYRLLIVTLISSRRSLFPFHTQFGRAVCMVFPETEIRFRSSCQDDNSTRFGLRR